MKKIKEKKCCKFHDRLDLKFPNIDVDDPSCGLAGMGIERYSEQRFCCKNCLDKKEEENRIMKPKNKKLKIICKTCFWYSRFQKQDWCRLIENEGGGSIKANQTECKFYLKKGTEPKWLCCMCKKNTYGESSTSTGGKHYCSSCWFEKERKEREDKRAKLLKEFLKEVDKEFDNKFENIIRAEFNTQDMLIPKIPSDPRKEIKQFIHSKIKEIYEK